MPPRTQYARSGDVHVAYQVFGEGGLDLVVVPGFVSHVEAIWEHPTAARFFERLGGFARVLLFDKRGTGLSDRDVALPTLEERMDDVRAVMDAAGFERAALLGVSEGGAMSVLFAATFPERTRALVLCGTFPRFVATSDHASGIPPAIIERMLARMQRHWGDGSDLKDFAPSLAGDPREREAWGRYQRQAASPGAAIAIVRMNTEIDVRPVLASIHVPTLALHSKGDRIIRVEAGRDLARRVPGIRYVELDGPDHLLWGCDGERALAEIEEFLTGSRSVPEADRVLATVLFTDIVRSTERAAELGDRRWGELLEDHHGRVRRELERHRGREMDTAGDGFFATFDGPARAIRCAQAIRDAVQELGIDVRAGLHTGECELRGDRVSGIAVHIGARVAASAEAGEVCVSSTVRDLVAGSGIAFEDRGAHALKGVPGEWRLFRVAS